MPCRQCKTGYHTRGAATGINFGAALLALTTAANTYIYHSPLVCSPPPLVSAALARMCSLEKIISSESPKKEYLQDLDGNTVAGDTQWREWFGAGTFPGADSAGTPLNTACICNSEICEDT